MPLPTAGVDCVKVIELSGRHEGWMIIGTPCEWRVATWDRSGQRTRGIICKDGPHAIDLFRRLCLITDQFTDDQGELRLTHDF